MIWRIARKEWTEWRRDGRLVLLLACFGALLAAAVGGGMLAASRAAMLKAAMAAADRQNFVELEGRNPHSASHRGRVVYTPAPPLAFLDRGLLDSLGVGLRATSHRFEGFEHPPEADRTGLAKLGNITAAGVLQTLAPLVLILLLFGAFAGERESGTLQQLAAAGIRPTHLLIGKGVAAGAVVAAVLAVMGTGGAVAIASVPGSSLPTQLGRLLVLLLAYGAYFAVWIALALTVSALSRRSSTAVIVLIGTWILIVGMMPKLTVVAAVSLRPLPTAAEINRAVSDDLLGPVQERRTRNRIAQLRERLLKESLEKHQVTRVQDLPFYFEGLLMEQTEDISSRAIAREWAKLWDVYEAQAKVLLTGGLLNPLLTLQPVSTSLTETDVWHLRRYFESFLAYRHRFVNALNHDMTVNARIDGVPVPERSPTLTGGALTGSEWATYTPDRDTWDRMPEFRYMSPGILDAVRSQIVAVIGLGMWVALAWGAAHVAVVRMKVHP